MLVVYGAGAVGLAVGARLARAGAPVLLVTRRPEAARAIQDRGVRIEELREFRDRMETWSQILFDNHIGNASAVC